MSGTRNWTQTWSPIPVLTGINVGQLCWPRPTRCQKLKLDDSAASLWTVTTENTYRDVQISPDFMALYKCCYYYYYTYKYTVYKIPHGQRHAVWPDVVLVGDSKMWLIRMETQHARHSEVTTVEYQLVQPTVLCTKQRSNMTCNMPLWH